MTPWLQLKLRVVLLALISFNIYATTGVAFVHGKGSPRLADSRYAWNYWSIDTVRTVTQNFSIPSCMAHYDGTLSIENAADRVAKQLLSCAVQKNIDDLVIETHSYGGVVMRWIFSHPGNPIFQALSQRTRWVNTIAAPQQGSLAANAATLLSHIPILERLMSWAGQNEPSTHDLTTFNMAYLNEHVMWGTPSRPKTTKPFYTIAGIGVFNDWYKLHIEDYLLKIVESLIPFRFFTDGVVSVRSAEGAGIPWFRTSANHFHNRRGDYDPMIVESLKYDLLEKE